MSTFLLLCVTAASIESGAVDSKVTFPVTQSEVLRLHAYSDAEDAAVMIRKACEQRLHEPVDLAWIEGFQKGASL